MPRYLAVTGTPGTGKSTLSRLVAESLKLPSVALKDLLPSERRLEPGVAIQVDPLELRSRLREKAPGRSLVYGHLVPDVLAKRDLEKVVVLRCEPRILERRLVRRGYNREKVLENVEAELIGVIAAATAKKFGHDRTFEADTSSRPVLESAKEVAGLLSGRRHRGGRIDWLPNYASAAKLRSLLSGTITESAFT